ncbi:MAG: lauroyl acyltransferase [Gammaproteobacteria bacterium]|jgi:KDO2-lipid IV(A) lauroyltransferase
MASLFLGTSLKKLADRLPLLQRLLWALEALPVAMLAGISRLLPADWASATGRSVLRRIGPRLDKSRKFRRNLSLAFPGKSLQEIEMLVRESWGNLGAVLAEFPHLGRLARPDFSGRVEIVRHGHSPVFRQNGPPAVFVTAHLANWEVTAPVIKQLGISVSGMYTPLQNPWLDRMLHRMRARIGINLLSRQEGIRALVAELNQGHSVGLLVDQRVDSGEPVAFFGIDMNTSTTPARLALRYDCDLIPVQVERLRGFRFRVTFHEPVTAAEGISDNHGKVLDMTGKINGLFEEWITAAPQDWLCSKRRWPKDAQPRHAPLRNT